jgi:hypothetical protein
MMLSQTRSTSSSAWASLGEETTISFHLEGPLFWLHALAALAPLSPSLLPSCAIPIAPAL